MRSGRLGSGAFLIAAARLDALELVAVLEVVAAFELDLDAAELAFDAVVVAFDAVVAAVASLAGLPVERRVRLRVDLLLRSAMS